MFNKLPPLLMMYQVQAFKIFLFIFFFLHFIFDLQYIYMYIYRAAYCHLGGDTIQFAIQVQQYAIRFAIR